MFADVRPRPGGGPRPRAGARRVSRCVVNAVLGAASDGIGGEPGLGGSAWAMVGGRVTVTVTVLWRLRRPSGPGPGPGRPAKEPDPIIIPSPRLGLRFRGEVQGHKFKLLVMAASSATQATTIVIDGAAPGA